MTGSDRHSMPTVLQMVKKAGFAPKTIIDVGVAWGTPELHDPFPDAYLVLVEALPFFEPTIKGIVSRRPGEYHLLALSDEPGRVRFVTHKDKPMMLAGTSIFRPERAGGDLEYDVEVSTLDALLGGRSDLKEPILLKVDAQGADTKIARGGMAFLRRCDFVILELGMNQPMNTLDAAAAVMGQAGFRIYDIASLGYRPLDGALYQIDVAFVRTDSPLAATQGYR